MRLVMPPVFISSPASMNSGMAIISSLYAPFQMRWGTMLIKVGALVTMYTTQEAPMAKASGTPSAAKKINSTKRITIAIVKFSFPYAGSSLVSALFLGAK